MLVDSKSQQLDLSILVVSYNCPSDVETCYESLEAGGAEGISWEFLVCENGNARLPEIRELASRKQFLLIEPKENLGFARANNLLANTARGQRLLLLNPDTVVPRSSCRRLIDGLANPGCRVSAPLLVNTDGSFQFSWNVPSGLAWEFAEVHYLQNLWRRFWIRRYQLSKPEGPWEVGFSSGACLCMDADTFRSVGGFDEDFFLNHEDIEFCDRIRTLGRILVFPNIKIKHLDGGTQRKNWSRFVKDRLDAKRVYLHKRYSGFRLCIAQAFWWEGVLIRIIVSLFLKTDEGRARRVGYLQALRAAFNQGVRRT